MTQAILQLFDLDKAEKVFKAHNNDFEDLYLDQGYLPDGNLFLPKVPVTEEQFPFSSEIVDQKYGRFVIAHYYYDWTSVDSLFRRFGWATASLFAEQREANVPSHEDFCAAAKANEEKFGGWTGYEKGSVIVVKW